MPTFFKKAGFRSSESRLTCDADCQSVKNVAAKIFSILCALPVQGLSVGLGHTFFRNIRVALSRDDIRTLVAAFLSLPPHGHHFGESSLRWRVGRFLFSGKVSIKRLGIFRPHLIGRIFDKPASGAGQGFRAQFAGL